VQYPVPGHVALWIDRLRGSAAGEGGSERADHHTGDETSESLFHPFGFGFEQVFCDTGN